MVMNDQMVRRAVDGRDSQGASGWECRGERLAITCVVLLRTGHATIARREQDGGPARTELRVGVAEGSVEELSLGIMVAI